MFTTAWDGVCVCELFLFSPLQACPLLHISLGSEQHLAVINPLARNLEGYKIKLQKVLSAYERS